MSSGYLGSVSKENGAYLIELTADGTEDVPAHELFGAASSLPTAKRVLKDMARGFGCSSMTWADENGTLYLMGVSPEWLG